MTYKLSWDILIIDPYVLYLKRLACKTLYTIDFFLFTILRGAALVAYNKRPELANIKQVAAEANVSIGLVSRYLNGKPGVGKESAERIADAIQKLNFRRNDIARALVRRKTDTVAIILDKLAQPFHFEPIRGIEKAGRETGYKALKVSSVEGYGRHGMNWMLL